MVEYRSTYLDRTALLEELAFYRELLTKNGAQSVEVSFGWDSSLKIEEMWQPHAVAAEQVTGFILAAEQAGTVAIGKADIFINSPGLQLTLCHESDVHIKGASPIAQQVVERWQSKGYSPYAVKTST